MKHIVEEFKKDQVIEEKRKKASLDEVQEDANVVIEGALSIERPSDRAPQKRNLDDLAREDFEDATVKAHVKAIIKIYQGKLNKFKRRMKKLLPLPRSKSADVEEFPCHPEDDYFTNCEICNRDHEVSMNCPHCESVPSVASTEGDEDEEKDDLHCEDEENECPACEQLRGQVFVPRTGKIKIGLIAQEKLDEISKDYQDRYDDRTDDPKLLLKVNAAMTRFNPGSAPFNQTWFRGECSGIINAIEKAKREGGVQLCRVRKVWETSHPNRAVHQKLAKGKYKEIYEQILKHVDRKGNKPHPALHLVLTFGKKSCKKELVFVSQGKEIPVLMKTGHFALFNAFSNGELTGVPHFARNGEETLVVVMEIVPVINDPSEPPSVREIEDAVFDALVDAKGARPDDASKLVFRSPVYQRKPNRCMQRPEEEDDDEKWKRFNKTFRSYIHGGFDNVSQYLSWRGRMGMEAGAKKNNMTVEEWAAHLGEKGMEAGAKKNNMTVEEWAAHLGEKGMEAGAKKNNMTVEEWLAHRGQKGGEAAAKAVREKYGYDGRGKSIMRVENMKIMVRSKGKTKDDKFVQAVESGKMGGLKKMTERHEEMREYWKEKKIKQKGKTFKAKTDSTKVKKVEEQGGLLVEKKHFACECGHVSHREAAVVPDGKLKGLVIPIEARGLPHCMKCNNGKRRSSGNRCMLLKQEEVLKKPNGPWSFDTDGVMLWSFWCNHHFEKTKSEDRVHRKWCEDVEEKKKAETVKYEVPNGGDPKLTPLSMRDVKTMSERECREKFKLLGLKQKMGERADGMRRRIMAAYKMKPNGGGETKRGSIMNFVKKK